MLFEVIKDVAKCNSYEIWKETQYNIIPTQNKIGNLSGFETI
jgi:hypothetical protein